jgi:hypothetical protein
MNTLASLAAVSVLAAVASSGALAQLPGLPDPALQGRIPAPLPPPIILAGGRQGWPLILSSLKSVLETGRPIEISVKMGPPKQMLEAVKEACATKPWRAARAGR